MSTAHVTHEPSPDPAPDPDYGEPGAALGGGESPYLVGARPEGLGETLSVALIGPDEGQRRELARALGECSMAVVEEYSAYPDNRQDMVRLVDQRYDVVILDLDSDREHALALVESICAFGNSTVMVYSAETDPDLLLRSMRAGAREYLTVPLAQGSIDEALTRAAVRRPAAQRPAKAAGKLLLFMGAKGGVGVTSVACNFAVALAQEPKQTALLIDLDLPLGDAALNLGIVSEFSTINALQAAERLDAAFLSKLIVKHSSGLRVLAAPGRFPNYDPTPEAVEKLLTVARQQFDSVVIDVGSRFDPLGTSLYREATTIYLVTQAGIPELRNSNRLINQVFANGGPKLEIVLNRFESRALGVSEEHITKALTRPVQWKIPNDHALVRKMQIQATPLVLSDNPLARSIRQMAQAVHGKPAAQPKKRSFGLFG